MADFNALEALINANIKKNGVQAITGNILNGILRGMVSALGKGYTIAGSVTPSSDPGTMTGPVAYIAYTAGTYTHFDGLEVEQGEVAMLIYNEAEWHKEVLYSLAANATVDGNVGPPEVGVSFVDGLLTFNFRNMKGEPGENGQDGEAAGFGAVTASVDASVGTPSVTVSSSGPNTAKSFAFSFHNLKGEQGVQGIQGIQGPQGEQGEQGVQGPVGVTSCVVTVDNTIGTPSCAVSLVGQVLHLDFTGLKGAQGDTGVSADFPITIANNLTTNDPTAALSAAQGVVLAGELSQLELKVANLSGKYYGFFEASTDLPEEITEEGYAFVGTEEPFAIWQFDGDEWSDSGATVEGVYGEPGVGFESVSTPTTPDGTAIITLSNGDQIVLDLNHNHPQYPKYVLCETLADYNAIITKDAATLYLIPGEAVYLGDVLIVRSGSPLPYTPVAYIETDGTAYIDTGIKGNAPKSSEMKLTPLSEGAFTTHLGARNGNDRFLLVCQWGNAGGYAYDNNIAFGYGIGASQGLSMADTLSNHTPIVVRTKMASGSQYFGIKQDGESSYTGTTATQAGTVTTARNIYIFASNQDGAVAQHASNGVKVYYCKIFSDTNFTTPVFDGVPCVYNGEYGLWDKVSNSFFGNAAGSGAFSGPQI